MMLYQFKAYEGRDVQHVYEDTFWYRGLIEQQLEAGNVLGVWRVKRIKSERMSFYEAVRLLGLGGAVERSETWPQRLARAQKEKGIR